MKNYKWPGLFAFLLFLGCASIDRGCSNCSAKNFGADWIVVQMALDGRVIRCWELTNTSIVNEEASDGIYWKSPDGHLVHISGFYNRVQVTSGDWKGGFKTINMTSCEDALAVPHDGVAPYPSSTASSSEKPRDQE